MIETRVPRIRENYHQVPRIIENRVPRIREIRSILVYWVLEPARVEIFCPLSHLQNLNPPCHAPA